MAPELPTLDVRTRSHWRAWLATHHDSSPGVWLVFHKRHSGVASISYEDAVREALCFGWIDSLVKRVDDDRYTRKFTPRKQASRWSAINRKRWAELKAAGRLAAPGRSAAPTGHSYPPKPAIPELPAYIARALEEVPEAWAFFQGLPATARRQYVAWVHTAKRPETRERRLRESLALLRARKRLGLR